MHALGALVGDILREQGGQQLFDLVEHDRVAAIQRRDGDEKAAVRAGGAGARPSSGAGARSGPRVSTWFQAVNLAEKVHRIRRRRQYFVKDSQRPQPGGVEDAIAALKARGLSLQECWICSARCASSRSSWRTRPSPRARPILTKQQRIAEHLLDRLDPTLTPNEARRIWNSIRIEMTAGWQTEDHPREKLTVADEREHVLFYLVEILYRVVPAFYEEIAQALEKVYGSSADSPRVARRCCISDRGSAATWTATPTSMRRPSARRWPASSASSSTPTSRTVRRSPHRLSQSASRTSVSPELSKRIDEYMVLLPGARAITPARHDRMPYRVFFAQIGERLRHTYDGRANGYQNLRQFRADVRLVAASLQANKGANAGLFYVQRLLRRIDTFGFHLATLDVRQHASVLHDVVSRGLDDSEWLIRSGADRRRLLADALEKDLGPSVELDALGKRTLAVFDAIMQGRHRYGPAAVGYFIVNGATGADDVLAALLLARWAEAYDKRTGEVALDIAPQFESLGALDRCGETMQELLAEPLYRRHLEAHGRTQCVLIGYSDGNKEGGLCASRFATHQAQRALAETLAAADERHVVFHARGGSIARGGGRIDALVKAAPAGAVNGVLRLTEQGEAVQQSYGLRPIAMRTLERAFSALSLATSAANRGTLAPDAPAHLKCASAVALASKDAYQALVYAERDFFDYFSAVTPIDVIERMQIGSRPVHRADMEGLDGLLPVPWVFAWTQTRHMIPGWYGAGAGFAAAIGECGIGQLRDAYASWFFLRNLVDDIETMLARVDLEIAVCL